jgi:SAM-dependent methyltransferase
MNRLHQLSKHTSYDRYPEIFQYVKNMISDKKTLSILSFGCSTGEEIRTLKDLYFSNAVIYGVDIDTDIIKNNKKNNDDPTIIYMTPSELFLSNIKFDIIFCMSVFCRWPETNGEYPFQQFEQSVTELNKFVKAKTGLFIIHNAKYLFTDVAISKKYQSIDISKEIIDKAFVTKYNKKGEIIDNDNIIIFRKK